ncbi:MAG: OmpH family outer membrane protein [Bacteroidales bacterium]|nr:OmpH family outer membrane protein [Bacteroidales bacterium]
MNKALVIAAAFAVSVLAGCNKEQGDAPAAAASQESPAVAIAVVNTDSLIQNYAYAKKISDDLMNATEAKQTEFNQKTRVFQQDVAEFQRKVQNNGFLSVERAQKEQQRLAKVEQDLQELNERLSNELMQEQARLTQELHDTIDNFLNTYAKGKYSIVLNNSAINNTVLYCIESVDITNEVVDALNARYNVAK